MNLYSKPVVLTIEDTLFKNVRSQATGSVPPTGVPPTAPPNGVPQVPDCTGTGDCTELHDYECLAVADRWVINFELTNSDCSIDPLTDLGCQILNGSTPIAGCVVQVCSVSGCANGTAHYRVKCLDQNCVNGATVTVSCPSGNSSVCTDGGNI